MIHRVVLTALVLSPVSAAAEPLTGTAIRSDIIGRQLCVRAALGQVCVMHSPNGTSKAEIPLMGSDSGVWKIVDDKLCVTWKKIRDGEQLCSPFAKGPQGYSFTQDGKVTAISVR